MQKLAVFFGGISVEHEISIITGVLALNAARARYDAFPVYISCDGKWYTGDAMRDIDFFKQPNFKLLREVTVIPNSDALYFKKKNKLSPYKKIDCALNCCHGSTGENGCLSGLLDLCGIASASPGVLGSSAAMDKSVCKLIAKASGIKTVPGLKIAKPDYEKRAAAAEKYITEQIGFPVIVKPVSLGSSIGISTAADILSLRRALDLAFLYDGAVLAEKLISDKKEINCAAYQSGGEVIVSECDQPLLSGDFLSFDDKYLSESKKRGAPYADIDGKTAQKIKSATKQLYKRLSLRGIVRADFLYDGKEVFFNELNTVPGSLAFYLFLESADGLDRLIEVLVDEALALKAENSRKTTVFSGGVIGKFTGKGGKRLNKM